MTIFPSLGGSASPLGSYLSTPTAGPGYDEFVPNEGDAVVQTDLKRHAPNAQKRDQMMERVLGTQFAETVTFISPQCNNAEILAQDSLTVNMWAEELYHPKQRANHCRDVTIRPEEAFMSYDHNGHERNQGDIQTLV